MKHRKQQDKESPQFDEAVVMESADTEGKVGNKVDELKENQEGQQNAGSAEANEDQGAGDVSKEIEGLKKQCEDYFNRLARLQADFENYKKRVAKERDDMYQFALESIMKQILPVVDNLERAVAAFKCDQLDPKYSDGVEMVGKQLTDVLTKNGLKEIEALEQEFDPNLHHAVMQVECCGDDENKVKEVLQKGYQLGCRVIRPSLVKVAVK